MRLISGNVGVCGKHGGLKICMCKCFKDTGEQYVVIFIFDGRLDVVGPLETQLRVLCYRLPKLGNINPGDNLAAGIAEHRVKHKLFIRQQDIHQLLGLGLDGGTLLLDLALPFKALLHFGFTDLLHVLGLRSRIRKKRTVQGPLIHLHAAGAQVHEPIRKAFALRIQGLALQAGIGQAFFDQADHNQLFVFKILRLLPGFLGIGGVGSLFLGVDQLLLLGVPLVHLFIAKSHDLFFRQASFELRCFEFGSLALKSSL